MSIRHAMLSLLSEGPKYGLRLREEFESRTGEIWPLNVGQVYTTLQRLERDGLIESEGEEEPERSSQKVYRLTSAGHVELVDWLHAPSGVSPPPRDELVIKVLVALTVPGLDLAEVLQVHRRRLIETMGHYTALKRDAAEDDLGVALVLDAELHRLDAAFRWLETAQERLGQFAYPTVESPEEPGALPRPQILPTPGTPATGPARPGRTVEVTR